MTLYLLMLRATIIFGVTLMLVPIEIVFDGIEAELDRQGVSL